MKVLLLILSSPSKTYDGFKETWKSYMKCHPNVDSYFIELEQKKQALSEDGFTLTFTGSESVIPGCLNKTLLALNHFKEMYDFVVRTNLSSLVHIPRLFEYLTKLKKERIYAGITGHYYTWKFRSGALFVMSKDIASFVAEKGNIHHELHDDVYIGLIIQQNYGEIGIPLNRQSITERSIDIDDVECFHYRFKSDDRLKDVQNHRTFAQKIYNIEPIVT